MVVLVAAGTLTLGSCGQWPSPEQNSSALQVESDRDAIIDAYLDWRGGEAFASMQTLVQQGSVEVSGLSGSATLSQSRDGNRKLDLDLKVVEVAETLYTGGSWISNASGQIEAMGDVPEINHQRALDLAFGIPFWTHEESVSLLASEERDGKLWSVLRLDYEDGDYSDLFVDRQSGALEWMRMKRDTQVYWVQLTEWAVVDGVRLPGIWQETHDIESEDITYSWAEAAVNKELPDLVFMRPSRKRRVRFAEGAGTTGWMPFNSFRRQRIFLPTTINGLESDSVLDSGAEMTVVDLATAQEIGLVGVGKVAASGTGGATEVQVAAGVTIQVGNIELPDMSVAIIDLSEIAQRLGRDVPVILGKEFFNETIVDIDYPNERIAFHDPEHWSYNGSGVTLPLTDLEGTRSVDISIEGKKPIRVGFDIGQGGALTLFEAYVDEAGLLDGRAASDRRGGGVGGSVVSPLISVNTVKFGGVVFENVPTGLALNAEGAFDTVREQGNLGTDIFARFRMIVNYAADELYLEHDEASTGRAFDRNRAGVQASIVEGRCEIFHVMAASPAEAAGIKKGDIIAVINGTAISGDYWNDGQWRWVYGEPGAKVRLEFVDGRKITLTLADFF
jgi:hypothetical protein